MPRGQAILVVEDHPGMLKYWYEPAMASVNATVDYARTEYEAIEKARCKTYDVAYIDIMLKEAHTDRGGVRVAQYIHELNEGTMMIVVTGTDDIKVAVDTFHSGHFDFIMKESLTSCEQLLPPLKRALECRRNPSYLGRFGTLCAYLAAPELVYSWEMLVMQELGVGYDALNNALWDVLERMLPIMRLKTGPSFSMHSERRAMSGTFWSKGLGLPIWLSLANKDGELVAPPDEKITEKIYEREKGKILIGVWTLTGVARDEYRESVWEEFK